MGGVEDEVSGEVQVDKLLQHRRFPEFSRIAENLAIQQLLISG